MRQLSVFYIPHPTAKLTGPWGNDLVRAIGEHHNLRIFDPYQPAGAQFEGIEAVVDLGGNIDADLVGASSSSKSRPMGLTMSRSTRSWVPG